MKNKFILGVSLFALATAMTTVSARAQDDDASNGSGVTFKPAISVTESYNDNIYTEKNHKNHDYITKITPSVVVEKKDGSNKIQFNGGLTQELYSDETDNNRLDYNAGLLGRYVVNKTVWDASADYRKAHSNRGDTEANPTADASEPIPYSVMNGKLSVTQPLGSFYVKPRLGALRYDYEDVRSVAGALLDQDYRDRNEYVMGGRIGYKGIKSFDIFADGEFNPRNYDDNSATERDSKGGSYLVGALFKPSKDYFTEVTVGYMNRDYDVIGYHDVKSLDAGVRTMWAYSDNGKVTFTYNRSIGEVTTAGVGGSIVDAFNLTFKQQLAEKLTGDAGVRYTRSAYQGGHTASNGSNRVDNTAALSLGLTYGLTDAVDLTADYDYVNLDSNLNTSDYKQNVVMVGVKYAF